jgi:uncharacterized protein YegL
MDCPHTVILDPSGSVQGQYVANLRTLIENFVITNNPPSVAVEVVDLTV